MFGFALGAGILGTGMAAYGKYRAGQNAKDSAKFEARQMEAKAKTRRATASRKAEEIDRQGRLQMSRALAVAAASGGGATDPTVVNIMGNIASETDYRRMVALYEGDEEAMGLELGAEARLAEGKSARTAGNIGALSTALSGASSLYSRYGFRNRPATRVITETKAGK